MNVMAKTSNIANTPRLKLFTETAITANAYAAKN